MLGKRGISPVIAVLLLIIIAVAAAVLTYLWVVGYIGTVQQQGGTQQLQERIRIEGVNVTSAGTFQGVYVRNIGDVRVTIDALYLINASGTVMAYATGIGTDVQPGTVQLITPALSGTTSLNPGSTYVVKVVTKRGTETTYTFTYQPG